MAIGIAPVHARFLADSASVAWARKKWVMGAEVAAAGNREREAPL